MSKLSSHNALRCLCEGAIMVAIATLLGMIKLWRFPWGGSITFKMLPLFVFALRWGVGPGVLAGFVTGAIDFMIDGGFSIGWQSILGDYVLSYTLCGLAGVIRGKSWGVFVGSVIGTIGRFIPVYVTGATLWAEYMPEEFFGMTMKSPWFYSALYNGCYVFASMILILVVLAVMFVPLKKYLLGQDIKRG